MSNFFSELKRRRVTRVALVYAIVAWAVIQGAGTLVQLLELPAWTGKLVFALALIGFPIAIGLAWAFDITPSGIERTPATGSMPLPSRRSVWFAIGIAVALTGAWFTYLRQTNRTTLDSNTVAVLPFRVSGAQADLNGMREGMVDLLAAKLSGEGGLRALDARAVINRVKRVTSNSDDLEPDAGLEIARSLGAGWLIRGGLVALPRDVTLSAVLVDSRSGEERARSSVQGPPDSISVLVDRLAAQLLARGANVPEDQLTALQYVPFDAVQSYLAGQSAYRHGAYQKAADLFLRALDRDSTFAIAVPGLVSALFWTDRMGAATPHVVRLRDRLTPRDRAIVDMFAGPRFPLYPTQGEMEAAAQRAAQLAPDRPEPRFDLGDLRFHFAFPSNPNKDVTVAQPYFEQALQFDSTFAPALGHLVEIEAVRGDTAMVRKYLQRYLAADSAGDLTDYIRWIAAQSLRDSSALRALRTRFNSMSRDNRPRILGWALINGAGLTDTDALARTARPEIEYAFDRGDENAFRQAVAADDNAALTSLLIAILTTYELSGLQANVQEIRRRAAQPMPARANRDQLAMHATERYGLALWDLSHGGATDAAATVREIRPLVPSFAAALDASAAIARHAPDARQKLATLDSIVHGGFVEDMHVQLLASRLHEQVGDLNGALELMRAWPRDWGRLRALATHLKEEGRLAAALGKRDEAIRAYTHYLKLRSNPTPLFVPERDWVRGQLAQLLADRGK